MGDPFLYHRYHARPLRGVTLRGFQGGHCRRVFLLAGHCHCGGLGGLPFGDNPRVVLSQPQPAGAEHDQRHPEPA
ncbi:MAG: hypothetical protein P4L83_01335, partial [Nevskia sp.]|nr:hypothetical protein [Nevskia sp.]